MNASYNLGCELTRVVMASNTVVQVLRSRELDLPKCPRQSIEELLDRELPASVTSPRLSRKDDGIPLKELGSDRGFVFSENRKFERLVGELVRRLPDAKVELQLCGPAYIHVFYRDQLHGLRLRPGSSKLTKKLFTETAASVADELADSFEGDNKLRTQAINAIWEVVREQGLKVDFRVNDAVVWIGQEIREFSFSCGRELAKLFAKFEPALRFRKLFPDRPEFANKRPQSVM